MQDFKRELVELTTGIQECIKITKNKQKSQIVYG